MPFFHCFFAAPEGLIHIADCLLVHICHGFPIPPSVSSDLVERVASEVEYMWYATFEYPTIQDHAKVGIGFLISEIWMVRKCGWYLWREHLCCTVVRIEEAGRLEQQLLMFRLGVVSPWREFISPGREVSFALRGSRFALTGRHNLFYYLFYYFIINVALLDGSARFCVFCFRTQRHKSNDWFLVKYLSNTILLLRRCKKLWKKVKRESFICILATTPQVR